MSIQTIQSHISSIQRELERLNKKSADKSKEVASKMFRINTLNSQLRTSRSTSLISSKLREINRLEGQVASLQRDIADTERQKAAKTEQFHKAQRELYTAQGKEQSKLTAVLSKETREREAREQHALTGLRQVPSTGTIGGQAMAGPDEAIYDAFISHASEDKEALVRPMAQALQDRGLSVWYDEFALKVGDSLRRSIDRGLSRSRFGIVVLSPSFFAKEWPQYELDGLVEKEIEGQKVILPLWHKVSKNEVLSYSPTLADRLALSTSQYTIEELADKLAEAMGKDNS